MKKILTIYLIITSLIGYSQKSDCDDIFLQSFYNFVKYDDSIGYSIEYQISDTGLCLSDTNDLINFILSDRYLYANSDAIKNNSKSLGTCELSYLAHHTNHKKMNPSLDSNYQYSSSISTIMKGKGTQWLRDSPTLVLRMYFVSALYYRDLQFKNEIVLIRGEKVVRTTSYGHMEGTITIEATNSKIMGKAYKSYQKWLKILNEKGLAYLRENNISPLSFANGIEWRNNKNRTYEIENNKP